MLSASIEAFAQRSNKKWFLDSHFQHKKDREGPKTIRRKLFMAGREDRFAHSAKFDSVVMESIKFLFHLARCYRPRTIYWTKRNLYAKIYTGVAWKKYQVMISFQDQWICLARNCDPS